MDLIDTSKQDKIKKKVDRRRERELSDIRFILKTPEGRRIYWRWMAAGRVFHDAFCGEEINNTNYKLGRQSLSRELLNDLLEAKPDAYSQMQQEREAEEYNDFKQEELDKQMDRGGLI